MEKLKLMKWADERFPPINLNENVGAVIELINEVKALRQNDVSGSAFSDEVRQMTDEIWRLSRYTRNHDNILYNYQDIAKIIRAFRKKHFR